MTTEYEALRRELHAEIDRRIDAAQPKEWPQDRDKVWSAITLHEYTFHNGNYLPELHAMGLLARTKAEAEAIRDRVSAFNKLWTASVADGGEPRQRDWCAPFIGGYPRARVWLLTQRARDAAWASLTDAERKALEG